MTLALPTLFDAVVTAFASDAADASAAATLAAGHAVTIAPIPNSFGWRSPTLQTQSTAGRIAWVPGDPNGKAGKVGPPVRPGRIPERPLATLLEVFAVHVYAANTTDKATLVDERAQYTAARELFDYWFRTVYNAGFRIGSGSRIVLTDLDWVIDKKERPHGACLRALMTIEAAIFDAAIALTDTDASALLDTGLARVDGGPITTDDGTVAIAADPSIP